MINDLQKDIEAVLFAYGEQISITKLAGAVGKTKKTVEKNIEELRQRLEKESALRIVKKDSKVQLVTASVHAPKIEKLFKSEHRDELGKAGLEVLAIIAYAGPVSRADIETIRGVNSSYTIRNLMLRGLVDKKKNGGARHYEISFKAQRKLGLEKQEDLPEWGLIRREIEETKKVLAGQDERNI